MASEVTPPLREAICDILKTSLDIQVEACFTSDDLGSGYVEVAVTLWFDGEKIACSTGTAS